ncbi:hypothetical protein ACIPRL_29675 [Streptomyces sp. NPDC090085]|uniref:hypothetical protein n=1 Tax=Streptomyces sp. NPDC090085 TaxID=3365943 RepID=UPI00380225F8
MELSEDLQEQIGNWRVSQADDEDMDPHSYYGCVLSTAPCWKVGGRPAWGPTDPGSRLCPTSGQIGHGDEQQLYICPAAQEHPHTELTQ